MERWRIEEFRDNSRWWGTLDRVDTEEKAMVSMVTYKFKAPSQVFRVVQEGKMNEKQES